MERSELARLLGAPAGVVAAARSGAVVVEDNDPCRFMAALARAAAEGGAVMLASPAWGEAERRQMAVLREQAAVTPATATGKGWLCIPTGGTGGRVKLARHDEDTISAAVRGLHLAFRPGSGQCRGRAAVASRERA